MCKMWLRFFLRWPVKLLSHWGKTEKMIFVSSDGSSASNLSKDIIKAAAQLPDAVESLTGLDLKKALKRLEGGK